MGRAQKPTKTKRNILHATWDLSMLRADLEEQFSLKPPEDKVLAYFAKEIYAGLTACTYPMATLEEAYAMKPSEWDEWFLEARKVNPSWFDESELTEESVTFSDGKKITVRSMRPSTLMKREALDADAQAGKPLENVRRELFRAVYYPKLAGCSVGNVPEESYARSIMTMEDLELWYAAAKRQVPSWFATLEEIAAQNKAGAKEESEKKSPPDAK